MAKQLAQYRQKRDFAKTPEPRGEQRVAPARYARFVIQKHEARRLHYDLRLEVGGVFKSWAVTRGPSLDPAEKRLAVEVEDHPLDYGDFEGTIPQGQYGGGTVMLWDRGFWSPADEISPEDALGKGELKFNAGGAKFKGGWVLVRLRSKPADKHANWLLIKHKDEWAKPGDQEGLLNADRSVASGRSMQQIARGKGAAPKPFIRARQRPAPADAVWNSTSPKDGASAGAGTENRIAGVTISNPDKILWPATKDTAAVTKLELAKYLAAVAPSLLAHIAGRPCSIVRAPDGIESEQFFQRHAMAGKKAPQSQMRVKGQPRPYLTIDDEETLIAYAQLATVEFHPWNCAPAQPAVPGRLIFDLDPAPGVPFTAVTNAARELRERLENLGLLAFCKTTGGKGLHVVTPLLPPKKGGLTWDQAKMFAGAVSSQMADDSPQRYLTTMTKKLRTGKIFIDYFRNDDTATAVAPFSPRARPRATVSMPLTWAQVRAGLDPGGYTVHSVPGLLPRLKAWADYDAAARPLKDAIVKLVGSKR